MQKHILVLNAGSSSLKFAAFHAADLTEAARGQVSGIGTTPTLHAGGTRTSLPAGTGFGEALAQLAQWMGSHGLSPSSLLGCGHRLVHGGAKFVSPLRVNEADLAELDTLRPLAPLHLPVGLGVLADTRRLYPDVPQVACFDTAFHATQPAYATRIPLPRNYRDKGYRRYGFHGLSYEHVVQALPQQTQAPLPTRLLVAHLGAGASMCAILDGRSVATTMGFSTADGLVMSSRTGSIDPGVLIALMRDEKLSADELENLLYRKSGLLGISGISSDMKELMESSRPEAEEAVEQFCYAAARHAASLVAALGGLDAIAFTGGIGEHAAAIRERILSRLTWLKIPPENVHVVPANEELAMARHVKALIG